MTSLEEPWVEIELLASGTELIQRRRNLGLERLVLLQRQKQKQRDATNQQDKERTP